MNMHHLQIRFRFSGELFKTFESFAERQNNSYTTCMLNFATCEMG
jgi:hypothetical protein